MVAVLKKTRLGWLTPWDKIATARIDAIELLLDACGDIGEVLHGLGRYDKLFRNHDEGRRILEVYFYDVLKFHQCVLDVFARPGAILLLGLRPWRFTLLLLLHFGVLG